MYPSVTNVLLLFKKILFHKIAGHIALDQTYVFIYYSPPPTLGRTGVQDALTRGWRVGKATTNRIWSWSCPWEVFFFLGGGGELSSRKPSQDYLKSMLSMRSFHFCGGGMSKSESQKCCYQSMSGPVQYDTRLRGHKKLQHSIILTWWRELCVKAVRFVVSTQNLKMSCLAWGFNSYLKSKENLIDKTTCKLEG